LRWFLVIQDTDTNQWLLRTWLRLIPHQPTRLRRTRLQLIHHQHIHLQHTELQHIHLLLTLLRLTRLQLLRITKKCLIRFTTAKLLNRNLMTNLLYVSCLAPNTCLITMNIYSFSYNKII
jgi:hypothetical protein